MKELIDRLISLRRREAVLDELSPAGRAIEQRSLASEFNLLEAELRALAERDPAPLLERAKLRIEAQLAAEGDRADPDLVQLQHDLTDFLTR